jgi:hypothetical protein
MEGIAVQGAVLEAGDELVIGHESCSSFVLD